MVYRSLQRCAFWLCLTAIPLVAGNAAEATHVAPARMTAFWLVALFGLQGLIAEFRGVRVSRNGISFPRRLFQPLGVPVIWRRSLPMGVISRVDSWDGRMVRFFLAGGDFVDVILPSRREKSQLVRKCRSLSG